MIAKRYAGVCNSPMGIDVSSCYQNAPDSDFDVRYLVIQPKAECRPPASLEVLFRGPGGRHDSTTAAQCFTRSNPLRLCAILRWRPDLLSFRGLHRTSAGVLLRRRHGVSIPPGLLPGAALLRAACALLFSAQVLPAGASLLPIGAKGGLPALSEPRLG